MAGSLSSHLGTRFPACGMDRSERPGPQSGRRSAGLGTILVIAHRLSTVIVPTRSWSRKPAASSSEAVTGNCWSAAKYTRACRHSSRRRRPSRPSSRRFRDAWRPSEGKTGSESTSAGRGAGRHPSAQSLATPGPIPICRNHEKHLSACASGDFRPRAAVSRPQEVRRNLARRSIREFQLPGSWVQ